MRSSNVRCSVGTSVSPARRAARPSRPPSATLPPSPASGFRRHVVLSSWALPGIRRRALWCWPPRAGSPPRVLPCSAQGYPPRGAALGAALARAPPLAAAGRVDVARVLRAHGRRRRADRSAAAVRLDAARARRRAPAGRLREPVPARGRRAVRRARCCAAGGPTCRGRSRTTTRGRALLAALTVVILVAGIAHRPAVADERDDEGAMVAAVRAYVDAHAPRWARRAGRHRHGRAGARHAIASACRGSTTGAGSA